MGKFLKQQVGKSWTDNLLIMSSSHTLFDIGNGLDLWFCYRVPSEYFNDSSCTSEEEEHVFVCFSPIPIHNCRAANMKQIESIMNDETISGKCLYKVGNEADKETSGDKRWNLPHPHTQLSCPWVGRYYSTAPKAPMPQEVVLRKVSYHWRLLFHDLWKLLQQVSAIKLE